MVKRKAFEIINSTNRRGKPLSLTFDIFIVTLIITNVAALMTATMENLPIWLMEFLGWFEIFSVAVFTFEYALRIWVSDLLFPDLPKAKARLKYIFSFMALIDLFAILPFYIPFLIPIDLRVLRTVRLFRLFRLFKLNRYTHSLNTIAEVFKRKASSLISSLFVVFILMLISAVIMYNVEHDVQPDKFADVFSSFWWAIATLATVGYGDIYPITLVGKIFSTVIIVLGIGLVALPTGIISSGFVEIIQEQKEAEQKAKNKLKRRNYCGKPRHRRHAKHFKSNRDTDV